MKVIEVKLVENCFDGTFIRDVVLSENMTESFIKSFGKDRKLEYYPDFPKPFFKVSLVGVWDVKGVQGENNFRVVFSRNATEKDQEDMIKIIENI